MATDAPLFQPSGVLEAQNLTDDELQYEYAVRGLQENSIHPTLRALNLTRIFERERVNQVNVIELYKHKEEDVEPTELAECIVTATKISDDIRRRAPGEGTTTTLLAFLDRLTHYYLRLQRYPGEFSPELRKLLGELELNMLMVKRFTELAMNTTSMTANANTTLESQNGVNLSTNTDDAHHSTMKTTDPNSPETTSNHDADNATAPKSAHVYVPSKEDLSMYAMARTPAVNWSAPPAQMQREYYAQRAASTQMPGARGGLTTHFGQSLSNTIVTNPGAPTVNMIEPVREAPGFPKLPGSDLRSLKQFMGNRFFDGTLIDKTHLGVEDFILSLTMYARSAVDADQTIIRNMASLLTGKALTWWSTQVNRIHTFGDFVAELRCRFATYTSDRHGMIAAIYERRQQKDETLADYVDGMLALMANVPNEFDVDTQIRTIVRNADATVRQHLIGKVYPTINDFTRHVSELAHINAVNTIRANKTDRKPSVAHKKIHTMEVNCSEDEGDEGSDDEQNAIEVLTMALRRTFGNRNKRPFTRNDGVKSMRSRENNNRCTSCNCQYSKKQVRPEVVCYGCGAPGVYKNDCPTCAAIPNEQQQKNELPLLESSTQREMGQQ